MSSVSSYYNRRPRPNLQNRPPSIQFEQRKEQTGILCTAEFEITTARCKGKVEAIIQDCRARNCRFRDLEFDLEEDRDRCLYGLVREDLSQPADVLRVSQIFEEPRFFIDGASSSDVIQGALNDLWFLSAVSTISTMEGLINRICVHRDEEVGVYGFVFYRDSGWTEVIIDDLLFTRFPRYEELMEKDKNLYHGDKEKYENDARVGGQTLLFSRSRTQNETWLPLLEKAFAKLNGDYQAIIKGNDMEAIEALTGGISTLTPVKDILNTNKLWQELLNVDKDRLFGCIIDGSRANEIAGLSTSHTYTVLGAMEVNGKRFVRLHNSWGKSEWKGPWSDGSKEWTSEWLDLLPELNYEFGGDGVFLMEYKDFLRTWTTVERSRVFGADWKKSSLWLNVKSREYPCAWSFGDVSFTFSVTEDSPAAIVLSQLNDRSFAEISGYNDWSLDFVVYRKGASSETQYVRSNHGWLWQRVASVELDNLEVGDYVLHVRLDRCHYRNKMYYENESHAWDARKLSNVWTQAAIARSVANNFVPEIYSEYLPVPEEIFGGNDLSSLEALQIGPLRPSTPSTTSRPSTPCTIYPPLPLSVSSKSSYGGSEDYRDCASSRKSVTSANESIFTAGDKSNDSSSQTTEPQVEDNAKGPKNDTTSQHPNGNDEDNENEDEEFYDCQEEIAELAVEVAMLAEHQSISSPYEVVPNSPVYDHSTQYVQNGEYQQYYREEPVRPNVVAPFQLAFDTHQFLKWQLSKSFTRVSRAESARFRRLKEVGTAASVPLVPAIIYAINSARLKERLKEEENNTVTLGLRIYTKGASVVTISGQLRQGNILSWESRRF